MLHRTFFTLKRFQFVVNMIEDSLKSPGQARNVCFEGGLEIEKSLSRSLVGL